MRLRKVKNALEKVNSYDEIVLSNYKELKGKWQEKFNNTNSIYLEIGIGKGKFIIEQAKRNPNINYIGLELQESVLVRALEKLIDNPLDNIYLLHADAFNLNDIFDEGEIEKIYLNFSDPWPKSRHEKRRLTCQNIISTYKRLLAKSGSIELKTDNRKLFEFSLQEFVNSGLTINKLSLNLHEDESGVITTEYEDKFVAKGNVIYFIEVNNGK